MFILADVDEKTMKIVVIEDDKKFTFNHLQSTIYSWREAHLIIEEAILLHYHPLLDT